MQFADDLVDQASHLAGREALRPKQASLRRAISSAYYGLFHELTDDVAFTFAPATPTGLRENVRRVLTHSDMKNVCKAFIAVNLAYLGSQRRGVAFESRQVPIATQRLLSFPLEADLVIVMNAFVEVQEARHTADYDLTASWDRLNVLAKIGSVRDAIAAWRRAKGLSNAIVFKGALLFQKHWAR